MTQNFTDKVTETFILGCDPTIAVEVTQTPQGSLFFKLAPTSFVAKTPDLDGLFLNLSDDSDLDSLNFFPEANTLPITGQQADVNMVNALSNGASPNMNFDVAVQFGLAPDSTEGDVTGLNFTLWSDDGPLTLDDIDFSTMAVIVNSDGPNGQVLTVAHGRGDTDAVESTVTINEDFDDIHDPAQSTAIVSDAGWDIRQDQLYTDGRNDGELLFAPVSTDGPTTISFDARSAGLANFEATGHNADSLSVQVRVDGGDWVTLDTFVVNEDNSALVGSETGQTFDKSGGTLNYAGGFLDMTDGDVQVRIVSDISYRDEQIFIDNLEVTVTQDEVAPMAAESIVLSEDFDDLRDPDDSAKIVSDGNWQVRHDHLFTNGHNDGILQFVGVETEAPATITLDIRANNTENFENSGRHADSLTLQVRTDGDEWQTLDVFALNDAGTALVGSNTGQNFGTETTQLAYSGGALDAAGTVEFRMISDISAGNEKIFIDNVEIATTDTTFDADEECRRTDFEDLELGDTVSDQYSSVTISAQRSGDHRDSENDAMIFDTANPTGGDHDLASDTAGNVIIISEDNDGDDPDDNARGGTISFDFESPSQVQSLNFLDIEEGGGTIDLYDINGDLISTIDIPVTGDGQEQVVHINVESVSIMDVNLVGSGAVDELCYISPACEDCASQYDVTYLDDMPTVDVDEDSAIEDDEPMDLAPD